MDSFNNAASSFRPRPGPVYTLREPQAFLVKESSPESGSASIPRGADAAAVRQSYQKKVDLQKRALAWTESLLEADVSQADFKMACAHITRATYLHILHERHLSDLCAYPLCARPPRRPYRAYPLPRSRIVSGANNTRLVVSVTGNDDDGFCSPGCRRRAEWVARVEGAFGDGLWEDGETDEVRVSRWKLLEEVEDASADEQPAPVMTIPGPRSPPTPVIEPRTKPTVKPESSPSSAADVLATLRIVENPTPVTNPAPPQLAPSLSTLPIERTAFQSASPPAAAAFPLEGDRPTTAQIREHERRRRVDASNNSLVPSDVIGFADSLITGAPVDAAPTKNLEVDVVVESEAQDTGNEVRDEDHEAWEMMEAAKREMYGLS